MDENVKVVAEAPAQFDPAPIMAELKALRQQLEGEPAVNAPALNFKTRRGDDETKAWAHYLRTGDAGAIKASIATPMAIGTGAAGGFAVPIPVFNNIIARRDELSLAAKLGVRLIPGKGTTVNVPVDADIDADFILKAEAAAFDADAPQLGQVAMTLAKYTKQVKLSRELLEDEDANIMAFVEDFVARGVAMTYNSLLLTEVRAAGTALKTFASGTVIGVGELEDVVSNADLNWYMDDSRSVGWVLNPTVFWALQKLASTSMPYYRGQDGSAAGTPILLGYPAYLSNKASASATSAKSVIFGNFNFVGMREAPSIEVLRDEYSNASTDQINLWYRFRVVFKVLQAEAIGFGTHASA